MLNLFDRITARVNGKSALYDLHPELLDRIPLMRFTSDSADISSAPSFLSYYGSNAWVYKAIKVVSDNISALRITVAKTNPDKSVDILDEHPLTYLMGNPNPNQGASDFWKEWVILQLLAGEVGSELVFSKLSSKTLVEMWLRSPETIIIKPGPQGERYLDIAYYRIDDNTGSPYNLPPEEFIFWKFTNPLNVWRGISPLSAVRLGIIIDQLSQAWTRLFFKNNARPDFAIFAPSGLTRTEKLDYETTLDQKHTLDNQHKPIVLESGVTDIKVLSFPPKDLEWLEQRKFSRDEVGAIYGVPDEIMGYGKDTYENFNTADRVLWTLTIVPLVEFRDSALTHRFRRSGLLAPNERVITDLSEVSQLREDVTDKVAQLDKLAARGYPVNILSEYLDLDLPPVEGGDIGYLPSSMVPISMAGTLPQAPPPITQAPPKEPPEEETEEEELEPEKSFVGLTNKRVSVPYGSAAHLAIWKYSQAKINSWVDKIQRALKKEFQRQENEIDRKLRDSKDFGRGKYKMEIPENPPPPVASLFDPVAEQAKFKTVLDPIIRDAVLALGNSAIVDVIAGRLFDVTNPLVQMGIREILETVAKKVNDTTWLNLVELFQDAEREGEGIPAIQERLHTYFGNRKSDWQTERIARTTMNGSSNLANTEAWKQSEVVKGHTWISALIPGRTRDGENSIYDHWHAHNQTVPLAEPFLVSGEYLRYPGDPGGEPGNIINCLCTSIAETE